MSPPMNYRVSHSRGANAVVANPVAMGTKNDVRWATGKNVKCSLGNGRFAVVVAWTCRTRDENGKVVTVCFGVTEECAKKYVETGSRW